MSIDAIRAKAAAGTKLRPDEKAKLNGLPVLLAKTWTPDIDPTGWWMSEKFDGVRGYWDGKNFISRQGNVFNAPGWFKQGLPAWPLDGELWMGRQKFQETISIIKGDHSGDRWEQIRYQIFDAPGERASFETRHHFLRDWHYAKGSHLYEIVPHISCQSRAHFEEFFAKLTLGLGAEGIMLRQPGSLYEAKRSSTLLKVKPWHDAEATVVGHEPGKGRHKGRMGALNVKLPGGQPLTLGSGFTDAEREVDPAFWLGKTVTYRYTELTNDGVPKCASFLRVRDEH